MTSPATAATNATTTAPTVDPAADRRDLVEEDLIEEVSIDGMCGVY